MNGRNVLRVEFSQFASAQCSPISIPLANQAAEFTIFVEICSDKQNVDATSNIAGIEKGSSSSPKQANDNH